MSPKVRRLRQGDLVEVLWHDSMLLLHSWENAEDLVLPASDLGGYRSVGYVMKSRKRGRVVLAQSWRGRDAQVAGGIAIPASAIDRVRVLR